MDMAPTSANMVDLVEIAFQEVKRTPISPMPALAIQEDEDDDLGYFANQQVAVDDIPEAHQEQQAPPNSPDISNRSNREESQQIASSTVNSVAESQVMVILRLFGIYMLFVATLIMPILKTAGIVWVILHDIDQDAKCSGIDCFKEVNQTDKIVYIAMASGFFASEAAHFVIGCCVFARWPMMLPRLCTPLKVLASFTALEILVVSITSKSIHFTMGMVIGGSFIICVEILALSNMLCYLDQCQRASDDDTTGNRSEEFELERQGTGVDMEEGPNTGERC